MTKRKALKKKAKASRGTKKKSSSVKKPLQKFKAHLKKDLGQVDWKEVGLGVMAFLVVLALKGYFGPKAAVLALAVVKGIQSNASV
jgi:hypothetical protein